MTTLADQLDEYAPDADPKPRGRRRAAAHVE